MTMDDGLMVDGRTKGIPPGMAPFPLADIGGMGWNVLREDMTLPLAVLKLPALDHNSRWMARVPEGDRNRAGAPRQDHHEPGPVRTAACRRRLGHDACDGPAGARRPCQRHRPHRSRQPARRPSGHRLYRRRTGPRSRLRLLLPRQFDRWRPPACPRLGANPPGRPLQVMVEIGAMGGRTGCRTDDAALGVARAVKQSEPLLSLRGIEGYEGMVRSDGDRDDAIRAFLDRIVRRRRGLRT